MIFVKITCNDEEQEAVFYDEEVITIGRSPKNTLQIPDKKASRKHCLIEKGDKAYRIVDMGSSNGTRVNGKKIEAKELAKGDTIVTGFATITVKEIAFPGKDGTFRSKSAPAAPARPSKKPAASKPKPSVPVKSAKPARPAAAPAVEGSGRIKVHRGPREMPMGLLDYLLVLVILGLILYILGVLFYAVKERGIPAGPSAEEEHVNSR